MDALTCLVSNRVNLAIKLCKSYFHKFILNSASAAIFDSVSLSGQITHSWQKFTAVNSNRPRGGFQASFSTALQWICCSFLSCSEVVTSTSSSNGDLPPFPALTLSGDLARITPREHCWGWVGSPRRVYWRKAGSSVYITTCSCTRHLKRIFI